VRTLVLAGVLCLAGAGLYARAVGFEFVRADDTNLIVDNQPFLRDLGNAPRLLQRSYFEVEGEAASRKTYYRPLVVLSYMLDAQVAGAAPWMYHLTNIGLHLAATLLVFVLARRLGVPPLAAFWAALLFVVHPLNTQAVAWVPGRNDLLMTVFLLASLVAYVRYVDRGRRAALGLHLTAFALALFTKEPAVLLVGLAWSYPRLWLGRRTWSRPAWPLVAGYAGTVGCWLVVRHLALSGGAASPLAPRDYVAVVAANLPDLWLYPGKSVLPFNLTTAPGLDATGFVLGVTGLLVLVALLRPLPRPRRLFVALWCALFLAPGLAVVALPAYEHRAYFPLAGLVLGCAAAGWLPTAWRGQRGRWMAAGAVSIGLAVITLGRLDVFRNPVAFWSDATRSPRYAPIAHVNLGQLFEERGDLARAEAHYREALALDETTPMANNNVGVVLMKRGRAVEAAEFFARELAFNPANAQAQFNLGLYYELTGRSEDAVAAWRRTLEIDPGFAPAYERLAEYYDRQGRPEEAARVRAEARALVQRRHHE
jgi:Tfp pilus assembly protein PilF